jgi:hypothetical protein
VEPSDPRTTEPRDRAPIPFVFPRWANVVPLLLVVGVLGLLTFTTFAIWYWGSPSFVVQGYAPLQPVPYSHKQHAGDYGIDCRYCHNTVEVSPMAAVPPAQTCMNCHTVVKFDSPKLELIRKAVKEGTAVKWVRANKIADFAYFDHSRHLVKGVGCSECHGRVDQMEVVRVNAPLSMAWCLDCHRDPGPRLRPREDVTNMAWTPPAGSTRAEIGAELVKRYDVAPPTDCSGCHR